MAKDILTENGTMRILNGDLDFGYSDEQHIDHILMTQKGAYKQHPIVGVGLFNYINSPMTAVTRTKLKKEIQLQLDRDEANEIKVAFNATGRLIVAGVYDE